MPRHVEPPPSPEELRTCINNCFFAATQCATYHFWFLYGKPMMERDTALNDLEIPKLLSNGILEATLMFFRKSHEFFKARGDNDKPDTLYAYRWSGFNHCERMFPEETVAELHKRVGHLTVREARDGHAEWPVFSMAMRAFERWIQFFEFLAVTAYVEDEEMREFCTRAKSSLVVVKDRMERERAAYERSQGESG